MAELKTKPTNASVSEFYKEIEDPQKRKDCKALGKIMRQVTQKRPKVWGTSMIGFGRYDYTYASGRSGSWFLCGYAPRKRDLTIYIMAGFGRMDDLLAKLGKHKHSKSCLYIKKLDDIDVDVLKEMISRSIAFLEERYGDGTSPARCD